MIIIALTVALIALPLLLIRPQVAEYDWLTSLQPLVAGKSYVETDLQFKREPIWSKVERLPLVSNVQIVDYDLSGQSEAVVCDIQQHAVMAYPQNDDGSYAEVVLIDDLFAPACCHFIDFNNDGCLDILVADLGDIFPNNERVGQVLLYINNGQSYEKCVLLDNLRRVADVRAADFDADGDLDLVVAEFGHFQGTVVYAEQVAHMKFTPKVVLNGCGSIHVPIADFDGDGDLDFASVLSQDEEEVWVFENTAAGEFKKHLIFHSSNFELGIGGLVVCDLDSDGDADLLIPAGDNLERETHFPQTYHGCYYLENKQNLNFVSRRIADLPGTYAVATGDVDGDTDVDIALVSMSNDFSDPESASMVLLVNDGEQQFEIKQVASIPIHLITCAIGDLNADGLPDILAGGLRIHPPFRDMARIHAWIQEP